MKKILSKEEQDYLKFIQNYEFIDFNGRLDLESFCVYLSACFNCDDILEISPEPNLIYNLLVELMQKNLSKDDLNHYIQKQNIADWKPEHGNTYPNKYRTYIHIAGLLKVNTDWIYEIGHNLMSIQVNANNPKYYDWAKKEWTFVFTFINGYHNFFYNFLKEFDAKNMSNDGYSHFEALHLATNSSMNFDDMVKNLISRNEIYQDALTRISNAIKDGYFLEAITLEESLITNCFYNFLVAKKVKKIDSSFFKLLGTYKKSKFNKSITTSILIDDLNTWRKNRNTSLHGFVTSREDIFTKSQEQFISFSEKTANIGYDLTCKVIDWYKQESIKFVKTSFD